MKKSAIRNTLGLAALAMGLAVTATAAQGADFYRGKKVNMYIGFGAGGGYDAYARLAARHLGKFIPGAPSIVPVNMPGAGGLKAGNYLYKVAPKDGTALGVIAEAAALEQILGNKGVNFNAAEFNWLGRLTATTTVFFTWHTSPSSSFADIRKRETTVASSGAGITAYLPRAMNKLAGANFKLITGYRGSRDALLAMERGEVETAYGLWSQVAERQAQWLRDGKINIVVIVTEKRHPNLPNVPSLVELGTTEDGKKLLKHLASTAEVGRSVLTTPGVPLDRVAALRSAFNDMVEDSAFLADAKKAKLKLEPVSGDELQKTVTETVDTSPSLLPQLRDAVK